MNIISDNSLTVQQLVQAYNKNEDQSSILLAIYRGILLVIGGFPTQRASYVASVSMSSIYHRYSPQQWSSTES